MSTRREFLKFSVAASGGLPGAYGEICLWNTTTWARPRVIKSHADTIYGISWRPNAPEFATASLDKTGAIQQLMAVLFNGTNAANGVVVITTKKGRAGSSRSAAGASRPISAS